LAAIGHQGPPRTRPVSATCAGWFSPAASRPAGRLTAERYHQPCNQQHEQDERGKRVWCVDNADEHAGGHERQQDRHQDERVTREEVVGCQQRAANTAHSLTSCAGSCGTVCLRLDCDADWRSQKTSAPETASQNATSTSRKRSSPHQDRPMPSPPQNVPKLV